MSGNFTQRGDAAVLNKLARARHAIEGGADIVLELPAAFAVSSADPFARGAVWILQSIPAVDTLAFGCESGTAEGFLAAARATLAEDKPFKEALKRSLAEGNAYAKAFTDTVLAMNPQVDPALFTSPNNILGTDYCRAILLYQSKIRPLPLLRTGGGFNDDRAYENYSSATAVRALMKEDTRKSRKLLRSNLPPFVYEEIKQAESFPFEEAAMCELISTTAEELSLVPDCSEGLENRLKALAVSNPRYEDFIAKTVSKRYTASRIKRILTANLLKLRTKVVKDFFDSPLYYHVLAVKKNRSEELFAALAEGSFPLVSRKSDALALKKDARTCFEIDVRATEIYSALTKTYINPFATIFV